MGVVWSDEGSQSPAAAQFIQYLSDTTGYVFALQPYDSMIDLISAMDRNEASFAWLQPEDYLYAYENNIATAAYLTSHYGLYAYGSSVYVRSDSGFELDFNEATASSNMDASSALQQFSDKVPCLVNTHSISGYAYPLGLFAQNNIQIQEPLLLQTHEAVIRAIYSGGICDFGFTYGISGDPRTSSTIQKDLPDVMDKVKIAWQSPAEIPSLNFSYATLLSGDIRFAISTALENYAKTPEGLQTVSDMNNYSIDGIRAASDEDYQSLRDLLLAASISTESLVSR
jgi:phosphonate transport system substrate-binding protein